MKDIYETAHKLYDGKRQNETVEYGNPSFNVYMYVKVFFNTKTCDDDIKAATLTNHTGLQATFSHFACA